MADTMATETTIDIRELSAEVGRRFSEVKWKQFDSLNLNVRDGVRLEVQAITKDLMRIAELEPKQAALIWDELVPAYVPRPPELPESDFSPEIVNAIEPGRRRRRREAEAFLDTSLGGTSGHEADDLGRSHTARDHWEPKTLPSETTLVANGAELKAQRTRLLLESLDKLYHKADDRYHFKDQSGEIAFEAKDKKLVTHHESPGVINSMIDLAEARGWDTLRLSGTKEFRKEAWFQAQLRGLETTGHHPTQLDRVRLDEARAERGASQTARANEIARETVITPEKFKFQSAEVAKDEPAVEIRTPEAQALAILEAHMRRRGDSEAAIAKVLEVAGDRIRSSRLHIGKVIETGTAPYQNKKDAAKSHFIVLEDDQGQRSKIWGVDLPRALEAGGAEPGAQIALSFRGRQKVTVDVHDRNPAGGTSATRRELVDRNAWEVTRLDRLEPNVRKALEQVADKASRRPEIKVFDRSVPPKIATSPKPPREQTRPRDIVR